MSSLVMAGCILGTSSVAVNAQENEKIVDGSALTTMILQQEEQKMEWREESILWMVNAPFPKQEFQESTVMDQQQQIMKWINLQ